MTTKRIKKTTVQLTRAEVQILISNIRALKISERKIQADRDAAYKRIDEGCAPHLERIAAEIERDMERCQAWAEDHPEEFAERKSIEFTHGTLGFRIGQHKLVMTKRLPGGWKGALELVIKFLPAFIRNAPEIDKEAIIGQRDDQDLQTGLKLCGLAVEQDETFFIEPKITEVETRETSEVAS